MSDEPDIQTSLDSIAAMIERGQIDNLPNLIRHMAYVHTLQAEVIQGERALREKAEADLRYRELHHFETEGLLQHVKALVTPPHSGDLSQAIWQVVKDV